MRDMKLSSVHSPRCLASLMTMQRRRWGGRGLLVMSWAAVLLSGFLVDFVLLLMSSAQNTKGASLEAAPLVPFRNFSLYLYFINLDQVNRKFWQKYIWFAGMGIGRIECFYPLDKNLGIRRD